MNRQPKAVGPRVVRGPLVALGAIAVAVMLLIPSIALARDPGQFAFPPSIGPDGRNADQPHPGVPWTADAVELAHTAPQAVKAGSTEQACTGWRSYFTPPPSIRVLRGASDRVETVPFRTYVETVMSSEWAHYWPFETVKVGAIAVKQYGWYYTIVYRGGRNAAGECFDVRDSTTDQLYKPGYREIFPAHRRAAKLTWDVSLRKFNAIKNRGEFFLTGYRTGTSGVKCGVDSNGKLLFQRSIYNCGAKGYTYEQILRFYLTTRLEVIQPGAHDILGAGLGDASVLVRDAEGTRTPRLFEPVLPDSVTPAEVTTPTIVANGFVGARSVDIDGNERDDLLTLHSPGGTGYVLRVALSDGTAYGADAAWGSEANGAFGEGTTLLAGDFDADGKRDAAILHPGSKPGTAVLKLFRSTGTVLLAPVDWWSGPVDLTASRVLSGDANGDGRADLMIIDDLGERGLEYRVAASLLSGGGLAAPTVWHSATDLRWATTRHVVGDVDRDGRDDLYLLTPAGGGTAYSKLEADNKTATFARFALPAPAAAQGISFSAVKAGSADLGCQERELSDCGTGDGHGDLVLYIDRGAGNGTRVVALAARYNDLEMGTPLDVPGLDWERISPY